MEALLGVCVIRRIAGFRGAFDSLRHILGLMLAAAVSPLLSATLGVVSLGFGDVVRPEQVPETWRAWWVGDVLGASVVAPLLLTWAVEGERLKLGGARLIEALALGALLGLASYAIFFGAVPAVYPFGAEILRRKVPEEPVQKHYEVLSRSVERMMQLIRHLLDASAIERRRLTLERRPEDTRALADEALEMLRPLGTMKNLSLQVQGEQLDAYWR